MNSPINVRHREDRRSDDGPFKGLAGGVGIGSGVHEGAGIELGVGRRYQVPSARNL